MNSVAVMGNQTGNHSDRVTHGPSSNSPGMPATDSAKARVIVPRCCWTVLFCQDSHRVAGSP